MHPKWQSYEVWFQRYEERLTKFFVILVHFLPFYSTKNPRNPKFKKIKKAPGDIIILHKCSKNHDHMLYCSWDMGRDRCKKVLGGIIILHKYTINDNHMMCGSWDMKRDRHFFVILGDILPLSPKIMIIYYTVPEIWRVTDLIVVFHFGLFFVLLPTAPPPNSPKNQN